MMLIRDDVVVVEAAMLCTVCAKARALQPDAFAAMVVYEVMLGHTIGKPDFVGASCDR
jgi:hypothetical protein